MNSILSLTERQDYDESTRDLIAGSNLMSEWTLLLDLTGKEDGLVGGSTIFHLPRSGRAPAQQLSVAPERGMLLLRRHGVSCLLHEGGEVKAGKKLVLRSDVLF